MDFHVRACVCVWKSSLSFTFQIPKSMHACSQIATETDINSARIHSAELRFSFVHSFIHIRHAITISMLLHCTVIR